MHHYTYDSSVGSVYAPYVAGRVRNAVESDQDLKIGGSYSFANRCPSEEILKTVARVMADIAY